MRQKVSLHRSSLSPGLIEKDVARLRVLRGYLMLTVEFFNSLCIYFLGGKKATSVEK